MPLWTIFCELGMMMASRDLLPNETIRCLGQVALQGEEVHGNDFQNYALEIKCHFIPLFQIINVVFICRVRFRVSEPLKILDSIRQSGGERVVATTLYLLSLQVC